MLGIFFKQRKQIKKKTLKKTNTSYNLHKETARTVIHERLEYFNTFYKLSYNRVAIRDQRRCWGSCSSKGNLNFSYKLLFLPPCLRDYIIVHELSHLRVLNHSADFWKVVSERLPDCLERATTLRSLERTLGTGIRTLQSQVHDCVVCRFCQADSPGTVAILKLTRGEISESALRTNSTLSTS